MATFGRSCAPYAPAVGGKTGVPTRPRTTEGPAAFPCGNAAGPSERDGGATVVAPDGDAQPVARARATSGSSYFTVTVLTADVLEAPLADTRTRTLYLPFLAGAFHLSE